MSIVVILKTLTYEEWNKSLLEVGANGFWQSVSGHWLVVVGRNLVTPHCSHQTRSFHRRVCL